MGVMQTFTVAGSPEEVRNRLSRALVVVGDVWFPNRREIGAWLDASTPLYVKWTRSGGFEIGPRLPTMAAARLCPVARGHLVDVGSGQTRLDFRLRFPRFTEWVFAGWMLALTGWGFALVQQLGAGEAPWRWFVFWALLGVATLGAAILGWRTGRQTLDASADFLQRAAARSDALDEDW